MNKLIGVLGISILFFSNPAYGAVLQRSDVFSFENNLPIENATATLDRREDNVEFNFNTTLEPGAYTVWGVIFNNPEFCVDGCGADDVGILEVNASSFWATGAIVEDDNVGIFNAQLGENQVPTGEGQVLFGEGLTDSFDAEIHLVARTHGDVLPGQVEQQITTFNGGCPPNECLNVQFAVFEAVSTPESSSQLGLLALGSLGIALVLKRKLNAEK